MSMEAIALTVLFLAAMKRKQQAEYESEMTEEGPVLRFEIAIQQDKNKPYVDFIRQVEMKYGLPKYLLVRIAYQESRFKPHARNKASGALGMFQLMPRWWAKDGDTAPLLDWRQAAEIAAGYLAKMRKDSVLGAKWEYVVKAYHCGDTAMRSLVRTGSRNGCSGPITQKYWDEVSADVPGLV